MRPDLLIYQDSTVSIYSPNLHQTRGTTFLFESGREIFIVDFGIGFSSLSNDRQFQQSALEVAEYVGLIKALRNPTLTSPVPVFLTHGHLDHMCGALILAQQLRKAGIEVELIMTPFTEYLLGDLSQKLQIPSYYHQEILEGMTGTFERGERLANGTARFKCTYLPAVHSLPQTRSLVLEINGKMKILFQAEFRIREASWAPGLSKAMLDGVAEHGPYDLIFMDGLRRSQKGMTQSEDIIREPLRELMKQAPGDIITPFIASKVAMANALIQEAQTAGFGYLTRGGAMRHLTEDLQEAKWLLTLPKQERNIIAVTGSQAEPGAYLSSIADAIRADTRSELLPDDIIFMVQGIIPMYRTQVRTNLEVIATKLTEGGIIIPRRQQMHLQLRGPNIYILEDVLSLKEDLELSSGHGMWNEQEQLKDAACHKGEIDEQQVFYYQHIRSEQPLDMEETGTIELPEPTDETDAREQPGDAGPESLARVTERFLKRLKAADH